MSLKKQAAVVTEDAKNGKWFDYCTDKQNGKMIRFKLRYMDSKNREWMTTVSKHGRKNRSNQIKGNANDLDFDQIRKIDGALLNAMVDYIVVDWENVLEYRENVLDGLGVQADQYETCDYQMPCTKANCKFLLSDLPVVYEDLKTVAADFRNFVLETEDDEELDGEEDEDVDDNEDADEAALKN